MSSILDRDFVMRLTREIARVLAALLGLRKAGRYDEAAAQLDEAFLSLFGVERRVAWMMSPEQLASLLNDAAKCSAMADLLVEEAALEEARGNLSGAQAAQQRAQALRAVAARRGGPATR